MRNDAFEIMAKQNSNKRYVCSYVHFRISARNKWYKSEKGVAMEEKQLISSISITLLGRTSRSRIGARLVELMQFGG